MIGILSNSNTRMFIYCNFGSGIRILSGCGEQNSPAIAFDPDTGYYFSVYVEWIVRHLQDLGKSG